MPTWCTWEQVEALVVGDAFETMCTEYAEIATSLLYIASGRRFAGETVVSSVHQVDRRGYIIIGMWSPVRDVTSVKVNNVDAAFGLSPAGTYVTVDRMYAGGSAELVIAVGQNPPTAGVRACAALAADLLRADPAYKSQSGTGDEPADARSDYRLTNVQRQGVSYSFVDPTMIIEKGQTGIFEVDLFIRAVNPTGAQYQPKIMRV